MERTAADIAAAGLPAAAAAAWLASDPSVSASLGDDRRRFAAFWATAVTLLRLLPPKPARDVRHAAAADAIQETARAARDRMLRHHARAIYDALTEGRRRFRRVTEIAYAAADAFPGLVPGRAEVEAEAALPQRDKEGLEIDQGLFIAHLLADETAGRHLCHAMLLPRAETPDWFARLAADGSADLGPARLSRRAGAIHLETGNPRYLNAEDQTTIDAVEIGVDLATLDPDTTVAVIRGQPVEHPKYLGRRPFGSGINLTHLYQGRIPFLWFVERELGWVHKLLRGVALPDSLPDDVHGYGVEKPWIGAVDSFAIGGHAQVLLVLDHVLVSGDAYLTLPAQKEGIIPGAANMRLPRFAGERLARAMIQHERAVTCDSPDGRLICGGIVPAGEMDAAIDRAVDQLRRAGMASAIGNRRAFRVSAEPFDRFREYMAVYVREQARCQFSPALIANLERHWDARNRRV